MIKLTNCSVMNMDNAIRGMRNPLDSWDKSDSGWIDGHYQLGPLDLKLAKRLCSAGSDHRKFMRQIFVSIDILAPLYWWKEFDTYKVSTVSNSTSTMHTIHKKEITVSMFSCENLNAENMTMFQSYISQMETTRLAYLATKDKQSWMQIIEMLPSSFNQLRTCTFNFETMLNMYNSRRNHKLEEWREFSTYLSNIAYFADIASLTD